MKPANTTDAVSITLYAWFATFGFVVGLVVALVCFHLTDEPLPVKGHQVGPEESGPQEKPAVRVSFTQRATARGTSSGGSVTPLLSRPVALHRYGGSWYWPTGGEVKSTHRVDGGRNFAENGRDFRQNRRA